MRSKAFLFFVVGIIYFATACKSNKQATVPGQFKGLFTLTPTKRVFKNCSTGQQYWVADSNKELEAKYWEIVATNNTGEPVYLEADGEVIPSNPYEADEAYANTLIVRKVVIINKDIPVGKCN